MNWIPIGLNWTILFKFLEMTIVVIWRYINKTELNLIECGHLSESNHCLQILILEDMKLSDCLPEILDLLKACRLEGKERRVNRFFFSFFQGTTCWGHFHSCFKIVQPETTSITLRISIHDSTMTMNAEIWDPSWLKACRLLAVALLYTNLLLRTACVTMPIICLSPF